VSSAPGEPVRIDTPYRGGPLNGTTTTHVGPPVPQRAPGDWERPATCGCYVLGSDGVYMWHHGLREDDPDPP